MRSRQVEALEPHGEEALCAVSNHEARNWLFEISI
jgi:hypothetical protein